LGAGTYAWAPENSPFQAAVTGDAEHDLATAEQLEADGAVADDAFPARAPRVPVVQEGELTADERVPRRERGTVAAGSAPASAAGARSTSRD
jgi:hypothetical protein